MQATVERSQEQPWVQVISQIAVHVPRRKPHVLSGATRILLAILVAAGPDGAPLEQIAQAYWRNDRPRSWRVALRVSASHLISQLPPAWEVETDETTCRLTPADGFVDAWRLHAEFATTGCATAPAWLAHGRPFDDITGVDLINRAARETAALMPSGTTDPPVVASPDNDDSIDERRLEVLRSQLSAARRIVVSTAPEHHALIADLATNNETTQNHLVVGDSGLLLPLGPFTLAFPELRQQLWLERGIVDAGSVSHAFRIIAEVLARRSTLRPQRVIITNATELDTQSLGLASLLIDRAPQYNCSLILIADRTHRDLRWLDFVRRSITAGCALLEVPGSR